MSDIQHVELTVPDNLNEFLDQVEQLPFPCIVNVNGISFLIKDGVESAVLQLGMNLMWKILDDRFDLKRVKPAASYTDNG